MSTFNRNTLVKVLEILDSSHAQEALVRIYTSPSAQKERRGAGSKAGAAPCACLLLQRLSYLFPTSVATIARMTPITRMMKPIVAAARPSMTPTISSVVAAIVA